ncbi:MAG: response regulator transcription factor [Mycobacteriales bacterium]
MAHILVVEDEPALSALLVRLLTDAGHEVTTAATGAEGLEHGLNGNHDLVLLDLMLPDLCGEDVLRVLVAAKPDANVVVVSSVPELRRRVGVLDAGAADFVAKPFANSDLLARVRLRLRDDRSAHARPTARLVHGELRLDEERHELVVGNHRVRLSQREFVLLAHLVRRKGQVCSRQELLAEVWGLHFDPGTNVVDVYVRRLRAKLTTDAIETVRNVGYRLAAG